MQVTFEKRVTRSSKKAFDHRHCGESLILQRCGGLKRNAMGATPLHLLSWLLIVLQLSPGAEALQATNAVNGECTFRDAHEETLFPGAGEGGILIQRGTVVDADMRRKADVYIQGGLIRAVGVKLQVPSGTRVIDAAGKFVMPGGIDPHTHLEMPFMGQEACDDFYSGQAAALAGGTTMHIDFALPTDGDLARGFADYEKKAAKSVMDYGFHMAVTTWNEKVAQDMGELVEKGINSFKFFLAYKGALMVTDEQLLRGFTRCKELGALPQIHGENGDAIALWQQKMVADGITGPEGHALSRPAFLEGEATGRAIRLARLVNVPLYVVHVMSKDALEEVARARQDGQRVIGEAVASGLALDESLMWDPDFDVAAKYVMSPPIRSREHGDALQAALAAGVLQIAATDHAVFNSTQKAAGRHDFRVIPNGVNGIEERLHIVWHTMVNTGKMTPSEFVRATSTASAHVFNIYPRKGVIAPGSDADVIILDPTTDHVISARSHHSRMDTNVYEGWKIRGRVEVTISQGKVVWENGSLHIQRGAGRFVEMEPFSPSLYEGLAKNDELRKAQTRAPVSRKLEGR